MQAPAIRPKIQAKHEDPRSLLSVLEHGHEQQAEMILRMAWGEERDGRDSLLVDGFGVRSARDSNIP